MSTGSSPQIVIDPKEPYLCIKITLIIILLVSSINFELLNMGDSVQN